MYVTVDVGTGAIGLAEPGNFKQFHIVPRGSGRDDDVADALGDDGKRAATPNHVFVSVDLIRRLAQPAAHADWESGFEKMLGFAQKMGWIDDTGSFIQAHIESQEAP